MSGFKLAPEAARDIVEIWNFVAAKSNADVADRVEAQIFAACRRIVRSPGIGHARADLTAEAVRFLPIYSYLIVYQPATSPVIIHSVLHGARDVSQVLRGRGAK